MRVDEAPIANPCTEDLDRMRLGPDGVRHCSRCEQSVHDLSAMGPERAREFVAANRGPICITYIADRRGQLVFDRRSDFVPLARLAQATLAVSLAACTPHGQDPLPTQVHESKVEDATPRGDEDVEERFWGARHDPEVREELLRLKEQLDRDRAELVRKQSRAKPHRERRRDLAAE